MANDHYTRSGTFPKGNLARGDTVQSEFDAVETGFDNVETELDQAIRFTGAGMEGPNTLSENAAARADKIIHFDDNGDPELVDATDLSAATLPLSVANGGTGNTTASAALAALGGDFEATTRTLFEQTAAPTGWTKETGASYNDVALRIVTGSISGGGNDAFTTVFGSSVNTDNYTLLEADIPGHTHTGASHNHGAGSLSFDGSSAGGGSTGATLDAATGTSFGTISGNTASKTPGAGGSTGGDGPHQHAMTMDLKYKSIIIASKDAF